MNLETRNPFGHPIIRQIRFLLLCVVLLLLASPWPAWSGPQASRKPELIRDTDMAEEPDSGDEARVKERDPEEANKNINVGNFYLKRRNYAAAIQRFIEALEYQPDSVPAVKALAQAYEKNGEPAKAISAYKTFLEKNPDSPDADGLRNRLSKLGKKAK